MSLKKDRHCLDRNLLREGIGPLLQVQRGQGPEVQEVDLSPVHRYAEHLHRLPAIYIFINSFIHPFF